MDDITTQAINNMAGILQNFLPPPLPNVGQNLIVVPTRVKPTGLGGFIGVNETPTADLQGRYIRAITEISLTSDSGVTALQQSTQNVTRQLLSQDRATLRTNGIFKIDLDDISPVSHAGTGNNATDSRSIRFNLEFEFVPIPAVPQGTINTLEYNADLGLATGHADFFTLNFATLNAGGSAPLDHFDLLDDSNLAAGSATGSWSFDAGSGALNQTAEVFGGPSNLTSARKAGALALVLDGSQPHLARDLIFQTDMQSGDIDGIGVVFRWQDSENYYFYLLSSRNNYHVFGKKVAGNFDFLQQGGRNETVGFSVNQTMQLQLRIEKDVFQAYLNGQFIVSGSDTDINGAGRSGFLAHRNNNARFFSINLTRFTH